MKNILGLIVEYNPFHYGHLHHIQASKKKSQADLVIAVMSGNFLQRGEPACASKWARTNMALQGGVDIVIELPYIFATQKADIFATSSVSLLHEMGVNKLSFGSESGNIDLFQETFHTVTENEDKINLLVKKKMKDGLSYPRAYASAFQELLSAKNLIDLSKPNNILGYQYVKAINKLSASVEALTIKREKAGYHDQYFSKGEKIASATAIRNKLIETDNDFSLIERYVPHYTLEELKKECTRYGSLARWENYFPFIQHKLLTSSVNELESIYECEEGLEFRLKKLITKSANFQHFMAEVKTKRYTWTRIQRLLVHILMNTTKSFVKEHGYPNLPPYIRILGMSENGRAYLSKHKKEIKIPIVTRASQVDHPVLRKDILASQVHSLPFADKVSLHEEYKSIPIII